MAAMISTDEASAQMQSEVTGLKIPTVAVVNEGIAGEESLISSYILAGNKEKGANFIMPGVVAIDSTDLTEALVPGGGQPVFMASTLTSVQGGGSSTG